MSLARIHFLLGVPTVSIMVTKSINVSNICFTCTRKHNFKNFSYHVDLLFETLWLIFEDPECLAINTTLRCFDSDSQCIGSRFVHEFLFIFFKRSILHQILIEIYFCFKDIAHAMFLLTYCWIENISFKQHLIWQAQKSGNLW